MHDNHSTKIQGWRAIAVFGDRADALLFLGRSSIHVRQEYAEPFLHYLDDEEREHVIGIQLEQWNGDSFAGSWLHKATLKVPNAPVSAS